MQKPQSTVNLNLCKIFFCKNIICVKFAQSSEARRIKKRIQMRVACYFVIGEHASLYRIHLHANRQT